METTNPIPVPIDIDILSLTRECRQQHGLKRRDFEMYRTYSARKLRRLRVSLNMTYGKGKTFVKREILAEQVREPRHLYQILFEAERAWAYAMDLKQLMERKQEEQRSKGVFVRPREYFHLIRRFKKAVYHSEVMVTLSQQTPCTLRTQLQIQAYCHYLKGQLAFEEGHWEDALTFLGLTKHLYEKLSLTTPKGDAAGYEDHLNELNEFIRVASFQLRSATGMKSEELKAFMNHLNKTDSATIDFLSANIERLWLENQKEKAKSMIELNWKGKLITMEHEGVRLAWIRIKEHERELVDKSLEDKLIIYDAMMNSFNEARKLMMDEVRSVQMDKKRLENSKMTSAYIDVQRLLTMIKRAFSMIELQERSQRWLDCARTLENLLPYITEVKDLDSIQYEGSTLANELTVKWWLFKAYRCMYLAHFYSESMKAAEAQGLLSRSQEEIELAEVSLRDCTNENSDVQEDRDLLEILKRKLSSKQAIFRASLYLNDKQELIRSPYSSEDLKTIHLIDIPPAFEQIPVKPISFDLAGSEIRPPSLSQYYEQGQRMGGFLSSIWKRKS